MRHHRARANNGFGFTKAELRHLRPLRSPWEIQRYLNQLDYHLQDSAWSPRRVLVERTAHCLEAAIFAAAALRLIGQPPLIVDLESVQDTDHVIAVYRTNKLWGALAKSNFSGLQYREPVYRTLRELVMSFFEQYFNLRAERTLRAYSRPVDLSRFDHVEWMTTADNVWFIPEHLLEIPHLVVINGQVAKRLHRVDARSKAAGLLGYRWH